MNKYTTRVTEAAAPHLHPGEVVELGTLAVVGSVSVKKQVLTALIVGIITLGMFTMTVRPARRYIAVTNQRVLFFNGERTMGKPGKLLFAVARESVTVLKSGSGPLTFKVLLGIAGQEKGLRLTFGRAVSGARESAQQLTAAFPAASATVGV
jgi:hypothetical protein